MPPTVARGAPANNGLVLVVALVAFLGIAAMLSFVVISKMRNATAAGAAPSSAPSVVPASASVAMEPPAVLSAAPVPSSSAVPAVSASPKKVLTPKKPPPATAPSFDPYKWDGR